jgi:hypothetical protein
MITRVNNITPINNKNNSFILGQLTADYADGTTITSIAVTSTQTALKDGDKFIIAGQVFTVGADAAAASTSITVDSVLLSIPIDIGDNIEINQDNLFVQYQRKTEGTIAGMLVQERDLGPINYIDPVYSIIGVDPTYVKILPRDFMINEDGGYEALEFKDASNTGLQVGDADQEMVATVNIPYGTTATEVYIWGSVTTKVVDIHECDVNANGKSATLGTGTTNGSAISITSTASTSTNYLLVIVKVTATSNRVYGGKVTLTQN